MTKTIAPPVAISQVEINPQPIKLIPIAIKNGQYVGSGSRVGLAGNRSTGGGSRPAGSDEGSDFSLSDIFVLF